MFALGQGRTIRLSILLTLAITFGLWAAAQIRADILGIGFISQALVLRVGLGHSLLQQTTINTMKHLRSRHKPLQYAGLTVITAAAQAGIRLIPISGFRSVADQVKLFERQIQRRGSEENAAKLSAPPGYSEHHTGYALDIGDGNQPAADLKYEFENTAAYQWLRANATHGYGFELSFPENNRQGVSFEPWHWRYVGSSEAGQIFAVAHRLL